MLEFDHKKATQAVNYLASKAGGTINKMKAIKLLYFAERYHLRKYGRPIVNDSYWALKYGPIQSMVKDILDQDPFLADEEKRYAEQYLKQPFWHGRYHIASAEEADLKVFSQTDIEALNFSYDKFGSSNQFELAEITHKYPEWRRHMASLEAGTTRERMRYEDFFSNPEDKNSDVFEIPEEVLTSSKDIFNEDLKTALLWE